MKYSEFDVINALKKTGIMKGDTVFFTTSLGMLGVPKLKSLNSIDDICLLIFLSIKPSDFNISDDSLIQEQTEQETTRKEFVETEKNADAVLASDSEDAENQEDSILEDGALKPVEESNNILQKRADTASDSTETKPPEQNSIPVETTTAEQNNESAVTTDPEENTEAEETEENSSDSSQEQPDSSKDQLKTFSFNNRLPSFNLFHIVHQSNNLTFKT